MNLEKLIGRRVLHRRDDYEGVVVAVNEKEQTIRVRPDRSGDADWVNLASLTILDEPDEKADGETTRVGYKNRNGQINIGPLNLPGTDHNQMLYRMRCGHCMMDYAANGSDIFQRRCPHCQDGAPSTGEWEP
jgi:hypothetical protein